VRSGQAKAPQGFGYWLLKFDGVRANKDRELGDPKGFPVIEYAYALMAKEAGISMSECRLLEEGGRQRLMTRRMDRASPDSHQWQDGEFRAGGVSCVRQGRRPQTRSGSRNSQPRCPGRWYRSIGYFSNMGYFRIPMTRSGNLGVACWNHRVSGVWRVSGKPSEDPRLGEIPTDPDAARPCTDVRGHLRCAGA
jgi:hypothetical protein